MLEHLAPKLFAARGLGAVQREALERCASVEYEFGDERRLEAGVDAWYCRHLRGLAHPRPDEARLGGALMRFAGDGRLIYAWLLGEQAFRCGLDVRIPYRPQSRLHDAYWLTHLVMIQSDYFARPLSHPEWADDLEALVPWLAEEPNADLAGEVCCCLRFLGRDATAAIDLTLSPTLSPGGEREEQHEIATALLALSAE